MAFDIYQTITDRLIEQLEQGQIPWHKPWISSFDAHGAYNRVTKSQYSLLNQLLLSKPGEYMSFKQCQQAGGRIRKGEQASIVVFWKMLPREKTDKSGNVVLDSEGKPIKQMIPYLRYSGVFHIDQTEGLKPVFEPEPAPYSVDYMAQAEEKIEDYCTRCHLTLQHKQQDRAFYSPVTDTVTLPEIDQFFNTAEYYSTAFHELVHSTGHKSRLDRLEKCGFGSSPYAKEELVAEIGSAAILNALGIETKDSFTNSAAYIQSWLRALQNDKKMIVSAASKAEKAMQMILNCN